MKKIDKPTMIMIGICILFFAIIGIAICHGNRYTEHRYSLSEINDDVYAIYYNTHSNVPAENYEVIVLCCEGNVYTFSGNVYISFTEGEPYAHVKNYNMVNSDEVYVYVPQGTIIYKESVNVSR